MQACGEIERKPLSKGVVQMTVGEIAFLLIVGVAFGLFSATIAYVSWHTSSRTPPQQDT